MSPNGRHVAPILVPYQAGIRANGMGAGPLALAERHGLATAVGAGDAREVPGPDPASGEIARTFELARHVAGEVRAAAEDGALPLVAAGECNSSWGAAAGAAAGGGAGGDLAVVWLDAHADFDTPDDNQSGFLDVMALSTLTGACWRTLRRTIPGFRDVAEADVVMLGVRDLEPYQRERLEASDVRTAAPGDDLAAALDALRERRSAAYLHVDVDVLDPSEGRANRYAAPGGPDLAAVLEAVALVGERFDVRAAAITAYEPECDEDGRAGAAAVRIAEAIGAIA